MPQPHTPARRTERPVPRHMECHIECHMLMNSLTMSTIILPFPVFQSPGSRKPQVVTTHRGAAQLTSITLYFMTLTIAPVQAFVNGYRVLRCSVPYTNHNGNQQALTEGRHTQRMRYNADTLAFSGCFLPGRGAADHANH